ncbi:MAG: PP2C family protein-serine/threonine phosphatase [Anaerolineae bacterium]|nr:serine/threonine-protein phosphatase [Anaerolineae bacterium]MDW8099237.1 PP2C family protein-serine/threonine phosphatase [Anaerolineae bacterium]
MQVQAAAAKVAKYAASESGDTLEMIERPHGGLSFVLVDGQRSGRSAKAISNLVARKAVSLLAEGVRDGAVARATHDYLRTLRQAQVLATLTILSVDLVSHTLVISRNSSCPVIVLGSQGVRLLDEPSEPIGIGARVKPVITEIPIEVSTTVIVTTDGVWSAGTREGRHLDVVSLAIRLAQERAGNARALADAILAEAIALDRGRPQDDISVLVVCVVEGEPADGARRLEVSFPLPTF